MTVRVYRSTDASAPTLSGSNGTLITVLDAVLVNGYGALAAAGWTKAFSATNKAVYRMAQGGGSTGKQNTGFYLNVQDGGPGAGGAREARVWGYQAASAQDTGTGQFPATSQLTAGIIVRKSTTADGTARAWTIVADDSVFYLFTETGDFTPTLAICFAFGDIASYHENDRFKCVIIGRNTENVNNGGFEAMPFVAASNAGAYALTNRHYGHYIASNWNGIGTSVGFGKHVDMIKMGGLGQGVNGASEGPNFGESFTDGGNITGNGDGISMGNHGSVQGNMSPAFFPYPSGPDNALWMSPIWIHHNGLVRGYLKGLWCPLQHQPLGHGDTFSGTRNLAGKSFLALEILTHSNGNQRGRIFVETSDTWS